MGDVTALFARQGLLVGGLLALGSSLIVGGIVGAVAVAGLRKLGVAPR